VTRSRQNGGATCRSAKLNPKHLSWRSPLPLKPPCLRPIRDQAATASAPSKRPLEAPRVWGNLVLIL